MRLPRWLHRRHRWRMVGMEVENGVLITRYECRGCEATRKQRAVAG
jgi:hypothetical protein